MVAGAVFTATSYVDGALDDRYPHGVVAFRIVNGTAEDPIARRNLRVAAGLVGRGRLLAVLGTLAYRPGDEAAASAAFQQAVLGALGHLPRWLAAMIDIESGPEPVHGDRSADLHRLYLLLTRMLGYDARRVVGYGARAGFARHWASRPAGMGAVLASYSGHEPRMANLLGWQYTNGYNVVDGLPSASPPYDRCDHVVAPRLTPAQLAVELGALDATATGPLEDVLAMYGSRAAFEAMLDKKLGIDPGNADKSGRTSVNGLLAFWLTRMLVTLRHGTKNRAFQGPPQVVDGVGLQASPPGADPQAVTAAIAAAIAPLSAQVQRLQQTIDEALGAVRQ